jgi:hypothetical protein
MKTAKGKFEINMVPHQDDDAPAGRMTINKSYHGNIEGTGVGQMISKRTKSGKAIYFAIEEFSGKVNGKNGAFTLIHNGVMDKTSQSLDIIIMEGSTSGELTNINGSMSIVQEGGTHHYELTYEL